MLMPSFEYRAPRVVPEAVALCSETPGAGYLAGGTDLLAQARFGEARPPLVIDIKRIEALREMQETPEGGVRIGAAVTVAAVARHPRVREAFGALRDCCNALGSYPLRHRATVVGNLCNASPCADTAAALLALEAVLEVTGPQGTREIPLGTFFRGPRETALGQAELVTAVRIPASVAGTRAVYGRIARRRGVDISTVAVLVADTGRQDAGRHRVSLLSVAPTPLRVPRAEAILDEQGAGGAARAAEAAQQACAPITDARGTAEYRRAMVGALVERGARALHGAPATGGVGLGQPLGGGGGGSGGGDGDGGRTPASQGGGR